jgi:hypothetical protein
VEAQAKNEIPPLGTLLHLSNDETNGIAYSVGCAPSRFGIIAVLQFHGRAFGACSGRPPLPFRWHREDPTVLT